MMHKEMMRNLPVPVMEEDIDEMFNFADQDRDGKISWRCPLIYLHKMASEYYLCVILYHNL